MRKKVFLYLTCNLFFLIFICTSFVFGSLQNEDKPEKGNLSLIKKNIWLTSNAGNEYIGFIKQIIVSNSGRIYAVDTALKKIIIFNSNGKFIKVFGKKGEGPGEIRNIQQSSVFFVEEKFIVYDTNHLHIFTYDGKYIKTIVMNRRPVHFINELECLTSPISSYQIAAEMPFISKYNIYSHKETVIKEFKLFSKNNLIVNGRKGTMIKPGVTPVMVVGYNAGKKLLYFGYSDKYKIYLSDLSGKVINSFNLKRRPEIITKEMVRIHMKNLRRKPPQHIIDQIIKRSGNNKMTFFNRIEQHKDYIFVWVSDPFRKEKEQNIHQVDIFSFDGKYIYKGRIEIQEGWILGHSSIISGDYIYSGLTNGKGETKLGKYQIVNIY